MSAAGFVLAINLFVAGLFTAAFGAVALRNATAYGARWLALAYGLGVLNALLEYVLPLQADPRALNLVVFSVALSAFLVCIIGLARHYQVKTPWLAVSVLGLASVLANGLVMDTPSDQLLGASIYQAPYFLAHMLGAAVVFTGKRRGPLDVLLIGFLLVSGLQFIVKPFMAVSMGYTGPAEYLQSLYGAYSQLLTAFLLIANGVLMLLIIVRDVMAEITIRSETDQLSGLNNRRGFEDHADRALQVAIRAGLPAALVLADLDHFKAINDTFGHDAGDRVIAAFARLLADNADARMVLGRHGGEEFAIFLPGANLASARLYAEGVRQSFAGMPTAPLGLATTLSASFGVTQMQPGDSVYQMVHRADEALYAAKKAGRDRVHAVSVVVVGADTQPGQHRGQ